MMQDYRATPQSVNNAYDNGLLIKPTPVQSMYQSGKGGFITGSKFIGDLYNKAYGLPENKELNETLELIQRETHFADQPFTQTAANWVADMVGYSLNPVVLGLTAVSGGIGGLVFKGAAKVAPKAMTPFLEKTVGMVKHPTTKEPIPLTIGDIGKRLTVSGAAGTGAGIPLAFEEGSASDAFMMGGIGMLFSSIPIAVGMFRKARMKPEGHIREDIREEGGHIRESEREVSPEIKQWMEDYENKADTLDNLERRATGLLQKEGFEVDGATHKLPMYIMSDSNVKNLQIAASDALTANLEPTSRNYLLDYIVRNNLDEIRENPKSLKIMQAYDNFLTGKLAGREAMTKAADAIHETNMKSKINKTAFLSQPEIYKAIKKVSREESHVSHLPFTLPESLERRLKLESRIKELKKKPENKQTSRRIAELEAKLPEIQSPKQELAHIKRKLIDKQGYRDKIKNREYERLEELADHWPQARSLLDRVNMEEAYEKQLAIKQVLDQMRKVMESPLDRLSNPDNVIKYFKERINSDKARVIKPEVTPKKTIEDASKIPSDESAVVEEYLAAAHESKASNLRSESIAINDKITQFRSSEKVRADFIQCMLEAAHG